MNESLSAVERVFAGLIALFASVCLACGPAAREEGPDPQIERAGLPKVYVVSSPLAYFANKIGGEEVAVHFPAPEDVDPAWWSPSREVVAAYQAADLILLSGAGYARWISRASLPRRKLVDTAASYSGRLLPVVDTVTHGHGPEGDHSHAELAFTTWLDPLLAIEQARAVEAALTKLVPAHSERFRERAVSIEGELRALDESLSHAAAELRGVPLLFSHPVYAYLEHRYDLRARSLHWEPDQSPDEKAWSQLEAILSEHPARAMIWEGAPLPTTRARLEAQGIAVVVYSPASGSADAPHWLEIMRTGAEALKALAAHLSGPST